MDGTEAFPSLGRHCTHADCHLLDFLPFTCDGCKHVFCLEHRTYASHSCPRANFRDTRVEVCADCKATIRAQGRPLSEALREHQAACRPEAAALKKRTKCPVRRCAGVLTTSNRVACRSCGREYCLRHRFAEDHACAEVARQDRLKRFDSPAAAAVSCRMQSASSEKTADGDVAVGKLQNAFNAQFGVSAH